MEPAVKPTQCDSIIAISSRDSKDLTSPKAHYLENSLFPYNVSLSRRVEFPVI
jgi:hypothetical protein